MILPDYIIMPVYNLILIRHGQSQWNRENRFTGWRDIDLSVQGEKEAEDAAALLKKNQLHFDLACTSVLKRAIRTLYIVLEEMDQLWIPVVKTWRLNERHYGGLTGLNKAETIKKYGAEQVRLWRRGYKTLPPLSENVNSHRDRRYKDIPELPRGESLHQTKIRVLPFWEETITHHLKAGKKILVVAHGNSLRALIKHVENLSEEEITKVEVPTGVPMAYALSLKDFKAKGQRKILK